MHRSSTVEKGLLARFSPEAHQAHGMAANSLRVAVVGGGPAGLLLAWKLLSLGHKVYILEKRGEYQLSQNSDGRSYNLTADGLGLSAFGPLSRLLYSVGTIVNGRAIHFDNKDVYAHPYGYRASDHLVSIARSDLLTLLSATIIKHQNCELNFNSEVDKVDVDNGAIEWLALKNKKTKKKEQKRRTLKKLDLIAFADGMNGIGRDKALDRLGSKYSKQPHGTPYLNVNIKAHTARKIGLSLDKIHFFTAGSCLAIALPNINGSFSALIEHPLRIEKNDAEQSETEFSPFVRENRVWDWDKPVFQSREELADYFGTLNPRLQEALKENFVQEIMPDGVRAVRPGAFYETEFQNWRVGSKAVLVGDAGSCAPPWAGFGMNLACSHAADLAKCISDASHDIEQALNIYNDRRKKTTRVVKQIIAEHGKFLNSGIGSDEWKKFQETREKEEREQGKRTKYQIVAFEENGLERLAGLNR